MPGVEPGCQNELIVRLRACPAGRGRLATGQPEPPPPLAGYYAAARQVLRFVLPPAFADSLLQNDLNHWSESTFWSLAFLRELHFTLHPGRNQFMPMLVARVGLEPTASGL